MLFQRTGITVAGIGLALTDTYTSLDFAHSLPLQLSTL